MTDAEADAGEPANNRVHSQMSIGDLEQVVISTVGGISRMEYPLPGVYVIRCDGEPGYSPERFYRATHQRSVPDWVNRVGKHGIYVGTSGDVVKRLYEHLRGEGAQFTRVFPPETILEIRKKSDMKISEQARRPMQAKESDIAQEYRCRGDCYVSTG